jgi:hypothetical protein
LHRARGNLIPGNNVEEHARFENRFQELHDYMSGHEYAWFGNILNETEYLGHIQMPVSVLIQLANAQIWKGYITQLIQSLQIMERA